MIHMRNSSKVVGLVLLVAVLLVAVGYAAITAVTLNINGSAQASPEQTNFTVEFSGTPTVSDSSKVVAVLNQQNKLKATMNVNGLTAKGDTATATYTIENTSADLSAVLSATTTNSNTEYFKVTQNIAKATIGHGETTTITVTVELIKTPITDGIESTIGVIIDANPQQPNA